MRRTKAAAVLTRQASPLGKRRLAGTAWLRPNPSPCKARSFCWSVRSFSLPVVCRLFKSRRCFISTALWKYFTVLQRGSLGTRNTRAFLFFLLFFFFLSSHWGRPWSHVLIKPLWLFKIGSYCPIYLLNYAPIKKLKRRALPVTTRRRVKEK